MRKVIAVRLLLLSLVAAQPACNHADCDDIGIWGLWAIVTDANTGEGLVGAIVVAREGEDVDTLVAYSPSNYYGTFEGPGIYSLEVAAAGYRSWVRQGIWVYDEGWDDRCHPQTVEVHAQLSPL